MHRDTVLGLAGAGVLVGALVGIFWYEGSTAVPEGSLVWDVAWTTEQVNGPQRSATTAEGRSTAQAVDVTRTGVARADFVLVWRDDVGTSDRLRLTVTSPGGATRSAEGANEGGAEGEVRVAFPDLDPVPTEDRVAAPDESSARERMTAGATAGTGRWAVVVEVLEAGDQSAPVPGLPPITEDPGQAWDLKTVLTLHAPVLTRA